MKIFREIVQRIMYILMAVQIVMGILYVGVSFGTYQQFSEGIALIPLSAFIYVLQIMAGLASTWYFLSVIYFRRTGEKMCKRLCLLLTLFLNTIPFVLQMHMALLSYSFGLSIFLALLGLAFSGAKSGGKVYHRLGVRIALLFVCMFLLNETVQPACEDLISRKTTGKKKSRMF